MKYKAAARQGNRGMAAANYVSRNRIDSSTDARFNSNRSSAVAQVQMQRSQRTRGPSPLVPIQRSLHVAGNQIQNTIYTTNRTARNSDANITEIENDPDLKVVVDKWIADQNLQHNYNNWGDVKADAKKIKTIRKIRTTIQDYHNSLTAFKQKYTTENQRNQNQASNLSAFRINEDSSIQKSLEDVAKNMQYYDDFELMLSTFLTNYSDTNLYALVGQQITQAYNPAKDEKEEIKKWKNSHKWRLKLDKPHLDTVTEKLDDVVRRSIVRKKEPSTWEMTGEVVVESSIQTEWNQELNNSQFKNVTVVSLTNGSLCQHNEAHHWAHRRLHHHFWEAGNDGKYGGISYYYKIDDKTAKVTPIVYDIAQRRLNNNYRWKKGNTSLGPSDYVNPTATIPNWLADKN